MTVDYESGRSVALVVMALGAALGCVHLFLAVALFLKKQHPLRKAVKLLSGQIAAIMFLWGASAFQCATAAYIIWNSISQCSQIYRDIDREIADGVLVLRFIPFVILLRSFAAMTGKEVPPFRIVRKSGMRDLDSLEPLIPSDRRALPLFAQGAIYSSAVLVLFYCTWKGNQSLAVAAVSWMLLFIVDDWSIISDYIFINGGRIPKAHFRKVILLNAGLVLGGGLALWGVCDAKIDVFLFCVMQALFVWWSYMLLYQFYQVLEDARITEGPMADPVATAIFRSMYSK